MAVIGWLVCLVALTCITFLLLVWLRFGGFELSPLPFKDNWWCILPAVVFDGCLWYLLVIHSPFMLIVR